MECHSLKRTKNVEMFYLIKVFLCFQWDEVELRILPIFARRNAFLGRKSRLPARWNKKFSTWADFFLPWKDFIAEINGSEIMSAFWFGNKKKYDSFFFSENARSEWFRAKHQNFYVTSFVSISGHFFVTSSNLSTWVVQARAQGRCHQL